jgi:hypothetical protein
MGKFKIGDTVMYVGETDTPNLKGNIGVITRLGEKYGGEYGYKYRHYFCFVRNLEKVDRVCF